MDSSNSDLCTARDWAAHASEFVFPTYRMDDGKQVLDEVIKVTTLGQLPDGRWMAEHGPFYCMADEPDVWVAFAPDNFSNTPAERMEDQRRWEAFLEQATFTSLDKVIDAAVAEQRRTQEQLDALARKGKG